MGEFYVLDLENSNFHLNFPVGAVSRGFGGVFWTVLGSVGHRFSWGERPRNCHGACRQMKLIDVFPQKLFHCFGESKLPISFCFLKANFQRLSTSWCFKAFSNGELGRRMVFFPKGAWF